MNTRSLIKGVSVAAIALPIAFDGVGTVSTNAHLVQVASAQDTAAFAAGQAVIVDADGLNVRADVSIDADVVSTLPNGTWATIVDGPVAGSDYTWYEVEYDDITGWVAAEYLVDASSAAPLTSGSTVIVNTEALNLRSGAGSTSDVIEILDGSAEGQVIGGPETVDDMIWYQVDFDGAQGWVSRNYLALPSSDTSAVSEVTTGVVGTPTDATPVDAAI